MVRNLKNRKEVVVVSDDKEIIYYVRYYGVKVLSVKKFIKDKEVSTSKNYLDEKSSVSSDKLKEINEEIKKKFGI
ncbi:MAG: hypothetical protein NZ928_05015 [Endomicrobia bacterium]|nr:hypothetical protein [Endomicrobiia bacterium]